MSTEVKTPHTDESKKKDTMTLALGSDPHLLGSKRKTWQRGRKKGCKQFNVSTYEHTAAIKRLKKKGYTITELCEKYNLKRYTLRKILSWTPEETDSDTETSSDSESDSDSDSSSD